MISYSLSMIPDWRGVLQAGLSRLAPGGRLHVVDFGGQELKGSFDAPTCSLGSASYVGTHCAAP